MAGTPFDIRLLVGVGRFELPTSRSRTVRSSLAELHPGAYGIRRSYHYEFQRAQPTSVRIASSTFDEPLICGRHKDASSLRILMISALEVWALAGQGGAPSLFKTLAGLRAPRPSRSTSSRATIGANHHHGAPVQPPPADRGRALPPLPPAVAGRIAPAAAGAAREGGPEAAFRAALPAARRAGRPSACWRSERYDLLYGYEVHGVLAQRLRAAHAAPAAGGALPGHGHAPVPRSAAQPGAQATRRCWRCKTPADLYVMTDDGTQGDEVLARLNPASTGKVRFWRNGLDLQHAAPAVAAKRRGRRAQALGLATDDFVLVTATRLARWKRIDRAIDAVALLRDAGRARAPARRRRRRGARQPRSAGARPRRWTDASRFVGAVPQAEVQRYLWAADVFLSRQRALERRQPAAGGDARRPLHPHPGRRRHARPDPRRRDRRPAPAPATPTRSPAALAALAGDPERRQRLGDAARATSPKREFWSWEQRLDAEVEAVEALVRAPSLPRPDV